MSRPIAPPAEGLWQRLFEAALGAFLGLLLLKFGNPPITEQYVTAPADIYDLLFGFPWPLVWAYRLLGVVVLIAIPCVLTGRRKARAPWWLLWMPLVWLGWQCLAARHTVDIPMTRVTLPFLAAGVVCFYLGFFALSQVGRLRLFWLGVAAGFVLVMAFGWNQHFGGLKESRDYFFREVYPKMPHISRNTSNE